MMRVTAHHQTERTHFARPQQVTVARRLGATFGYTLMNRPQLVHVVTLIAA